MHQRQNPPPPPMKTFRIIYGAMIASTFVYLGLLASGTLSVPPAEDSTIAYALAVAALASAAACLLVPRSLHASAVRRVELEIDEVPDPNASVMFRNQTPTIRAFADPEAADATGRRLYFVAFILRLAFSESVALYGFTLGMTGYTLPVVIPFFLLSWTLFALSAPRESRWRAPLEARFDARFVES